MIQTLLRIQLSVAGTGSTRNNLDSTSEERELETEIVNLIEQLPIIDPWMYENLFGIPKMPMLQLKKVLYLH